MLNDMQNIRMLGKYGNLKKIFKYTIQNTQILKYSLSTKQLL